jgi:hypothetical protein
VDPWRLLTLSPLPEVERAKPSTSSHAPVRPAIGIGPIRLPGYLDEDQIVTRVSRNRLTLSENARWAEPLGDNIARVMAQDLSVLLPDNPVTVDLLPGRQRPTYQLAIDVSSFETDTSGTSFLAARWFLRDVATRQTIAGQEVRLTAPAAGGSSEQSVASLSKALGEFSAGIADLIRGLVQTSGTPGGKISSSR